jgi:phosphate starvation-inducible protein PhoH
LENRAIRRGSAYLLHWYGVPKAHYKDSDQLPPSWEKLKRSAEEAKDWLELTYLVECGREFNQEQIEERIKELRALRGSEHVLAVARAVRHELRLGNEGAVYCRTTSNKRPTGTPYVKRGDVALGAGLTGGGDTYIGYRKVIFD